MRTALAGGNMRCLESYKSHREELQMLHGTGREYGGRKLEDVEQVTEISLR